MLRMSVLAVSVASVLGLGWVTRAFASPWRRVVMQKRFEKAERVDLAGLGSIDLPPSFKPIGRGWAGTRNGNFSPETLDQHRDDYQITFRFEQGQYHMLGGYLADPVLLHVTLFNPNKPKPNATKITFTTIPKFYPPVNDDWTRFNAHFDAQRWLPDVVTGDAVTRTAATGEGRGDNVVAGPPLRWLVIHTDPTRRIRVDLYVWRKMYSADEARALVRRVAESVQTTPKLAEMFDAVKDVDARDDAKFEATVSSALGALQQCGISSMGPGMVAWSDRCASWMSENRYYLQLARTVGRIPLAATKERFNGAPFWAVVLPEGRSPKLNSGGFRLAQLFWDDAAKRWSIAGFGEHLFDDDTIDSPLIAAIVPRLHDRTSVHVIAISNYNFKFYPGPQTIAEFVAEADHVGQALREGKVVAGVRGAPFGLEKR